jgi:hypothetical protein
MDVDTPFSTYRLVLADMHHNLTPKNFSLGVGGRLTARHILAGKKSDERI